MQWWQRAVHAWRGLSPSARVGLVAATATAVLMSAVLVVGTVVAAVALFWSTPAGPGVEAAPEAVGEAGRASSPTPTPSATVDTPSPTRSSPVPGTETPPEPTTSPAPAGPRGDGAPLVREGRVAAVVDGDTLDLADGTRVRLAIVDTPEVHGGTEPCGPEATAFTRDVVRGRRVAVYRPASAPRADQYGRLLGEVVRDDGRSLNVALAAAGLGSVDERFTGEDPDLARRARAAAAGAPRPACAQPEPQPDPGSGHTGRTDGGWPCHAAYRECLPAGAPDLDCGDIGHQVEVADPGDPWRLDGDGDGRGCESDAAWSPTVTYPYY